VCMLMMSLRELPHIGACTGVALQTKVETKDGLYWFDNHRAFIQKQIFHFFRHHVSCTKRVRSILHFINKGEYTYLGPSRGHMYLICMSCNMNPNLYLPSHLNLT
jgi:hypothetical protein